MRTFKFRTLELWLNSSIMILKNNNNKTEYFLTETTLGPQPQAMKSAQGDASTVLITQNHHQCLLEAMRSTQPTTESC